MINFSRLAKGLSLTFIIALTVEYSQAQTYWGMTNSGGSNDIGTIFTMDQAGTFAKKHDFFRVEGASPKGELIQATNGKYYGVTELGGTNGIGTLFEYDPNTGNYTTLHDMTITSGSKPLRGLVQAANGRLYGMCAEGGTNGFGVIFDYNIGTGIYVVRNHFNNTNGRAPRGKLYEATNGRLYGVTQLGGTGARGVLFNFNPANNITTKIHDFTLATGGQPFSGPIQASNGRLYGTAQVGGANSGGVVYQFVISTGVYTIIQDLDLTIGRFPLSEVMQASNGIIYGATSSGGTSNSGVIFSVTPTTSTYAKLVDLGPALGVSPYGGMVQASNGLLYGMTERGGAGDLGVLYSFNTTTNAYTNLVDMSSGGYGSPWGGLIEGTTGSLLGLCSEAGSGNAGALFSYNISSNLFDEIVAMGFSEGSQPNGRMTLSSNGKLYGVTSLGGISAQGIVFSIDPNTDAFERLVDFTATQGGFPIGNLEFSSGKLYGLCAAGGSASIGTIFEFDPNTNVLVKKKDLDASTGGTPLTGFYKATNGKLYSMMSTGGVNSVGALIEYDPVTNAVLRRHDFSTAEGTTPKADLMQASNGLIYGSLSTNGQFGDGSLFSFNTTSGTFTILYSFDFFQGGTPAGQLLQASNGKLYGIASDGAGFFNGCMYNWDIVAGTYTQEYDLETVDGSGSESSLIEGTDGKLYGTAAQGGSADNGTIFRYDPGSLVFTRLKDYASTTDGQYPLDGLVSAVPSSASVSMNIKVFLEGPYDSGSGLMNDALRSIPQFPTTEPYTALGFIQVGEGGGESISASVLTTAGNNAVVDWVMVELRDKNNNATVVNTRSALVQRDGDVVDLDGVSALSMGVAADDYFISVRHRNHLGVMKASTVALSTTPATIDFTNGSTVTFGSDAQKLDGSALVNWAGNVNPNNELKYTGAGNDRDPILVKIGGSVPTAVFNGYENEDVTLDGQVKYTGAGNDRDPILVNIGGSIPTAVKPEQLP